MLRFIQKYLPDFVFVENVPGFQKMNAAAEAFDEILQGLHNLGYFTEYKVVNSQDYGVPQKRARLIMLASISFPIRFPDATHGPGAPRGGFSTVSDWIGKLPHLAAGETHPNMPNHRSSRLSPLNLRRIRATPEGGSWPDLPPELVPNCHRSGFRGYSDVYGRLRWDSPAPAMTTRCISYSNGRFGHPDQDRALSVREAATLQTFPIDFVIKGNHTSQARQVGNAVPLLLSQRFGESINEQLQGFHSSATPESECLDARVATTTAERL